MSKVVVKDGRYTVESLFQWDKNQVLTIHGLSLSSAPEIHFANNDMVGAIVRQSRMDNAGVITADIPNSLLQSNAKISAYLYRKNGNTYETEYHIVIPVRGRSKPADYTLDVNDVEVYSFNEMNAQIAEIQQLVESLQKNIVATFGYYDETMSSILEQLQNGFEIAEIADGAVSTGSLQNKSVTTDKLADGSISTAKLVNYAITALKIATGAVTTDKIADGAITDAKIPDGEIGTAKLAQSAVTSEKIADGAVTTNKLGSNSVTNAKIANSTIAIEKLAFTPAQYVVGTYQGNGESGWGSKNSLTFPFVPKMVLIVDETYGANSYGSVCWMGQNFGASHVQFELNNKTLSWYTTYDESPGYQMNEFGDRYTYLAIG